jgi:ABC-2 type transport system permease protein
MNPRRLKAVAKKEFLHVLRDPRSLMMGIGVPMLLLFLFGYALTMDIDRVPLAVWDQGNSSESRELVSRFSGSNYFRISTNVSSYREIEQAIDSRQVLIAVVIPPEFSRQLAQGQNVQLQGIVDGSDPNTATIALGYAEAVVGTYSRDVALKQMHRTNPVIAKSSLPALDLKPRVWFNTDMISRNYIFPGLIAVVMMIMAAILTSLCIAREWETGTMEQLVATPLTPAELIWGKMLPYFCIGLLDLFLCIGVGQFIFDVPLRGSLMLLMPLATVFLFGALAFGMLLSIITRSQLLASQLAIITTVLPAFLLSGFIFPIENMPLPIQTVTRIVTARYFVNILRGIYQKDVGLTVLWPEVLFLGLFGVIAMTVAVKKFRKKIH